MPATLQPWVLEHQKFRINNESPFNFHSIWICYLPFMKENYNAWRINNSLFFMWSRKKAQVITATNNLSIVATLITWCLKWKEKSEMHTLKTIMKSLIKNTPHCALRKTFHGILADPEQIWRCAFFAFFQKVPLFNPRTDTPVHQIRRSVPGNEWIL